MLQQRANALHERRGVPAVDDAFLFKLMAREILLKRGYLLTYMPKPLVGKGGNGLHFNMSLSDEGGGNAINDPKGKDGLSDLARECVAGLIAHHEGMTALLAPTVNSYRRLRPASLAGYWANWGHDHRGVAVRVPAERGHRPTQPEKPARSAFAEAQILSQGVHGSC